MRRDLAARLRIATDFLTSGESQATFCNRTGIPPRTLRSLVALLRPQDPRGQALDIVRKARADLDALLQALEAAAGSRSPAPAPAEGSRRVVPSVCAKQPVLAERQKEAPESTQQAAAAEVSAGQLPAEPGSSVNLQPAQVSRQRRKGFLWDDDP